MKRLFALAPALVLAAALGMSGAEARGLKGGNISGGEVAANWGNNGKSHINQNGNGCRNRCYFYGDGPTLNAGFNNGNTNVGGGGGSGGNFQSIINRGPGKSHSGCGFC